MRRARATSLVVIVVVAAGWLAATLVGGNSPQLGLDLQGGASVVLRAKGDVNSAQLKQAQEIIRNRVDALGVAEPDIHLEGENIVVQLPGVKNATRALALVGQTAKLFFRPVCFTYPPGADSLISVDLTNPDCSAVATPTDSTSTTLPADSTTTTLPPESTTSSETPRGLPQQESTTTTTAATTSSSDSTTSSSDSTTSTTEASTTTTEVVPGKECGPDHSDPETEDPDAKVIFPEKDGSTVTLCYVLGPVALEGKDVRGATARLQNVWVVELELTDDGLAAMNTMAAACSSGDPTICPIQQGGTSGRFAIVLDGVVKSAPGFNSPTFAENTLIIERPDGFPQGEAKDLALVLKYGALPVELEPQTVQTVSATLGKDSLHAGLVAGFVGIGLVAVYMIMYYRALGIVVILGMGVWGALNYSIITYLSKESGLALSLAGVTGIIVSVGVTVDSYVVYFERLKDEIRSGKTLRSSVDRGFKRAFRTILAADISSFIGAFLLYWLTVGGVRGFAFFLGLSTILDVVVAWMFTRPLVALLGRSRFFTEARWVGVARGLGGGQAAPASAPAGGGR